MMDQPDYEGAVAYALSRLKNELSPDLTYHNLWHTQDDVMVTAVRLAHLLALGEEEVGLLRVAAAFHDLGFVEDVANHELVGARIVAQLLPEFAFSSRQIEIIMGLILATRMPQSPRSLLEEILADSDLDLLGRPDFMARNACLRQEWANEGRVVTMREWYEGQLSFMRGHDYFTAVAQRLRNETKQRNIVLLEEKLRSLG
ncbi:MAG: HD domain-containing protein [Anaerolineales bacterium]|nr:HD domain-containing protein [Anaerolineales bacterium]